MKPPRAFTLERGQGFGVLPTTFEETFHDAALAPEDCISLQDVPAVGYVALVARNPETGQIVLRIECDDDARIARWLSKAARYVLAVFYRVRSSQIQLVH